MTTIEQLLTEKAAKQFSEIQRITVELAQVKRERDELQKGFANLTKAGTEQYVQLTTLAQSNQRLREVLQKIWDADEMGYLTSDQVPNVQECLGCGVNQHTQVTSPNAINHTEECVQGWIEEALSTPAPAIEKVKEDGNG